MGGSQSAPDRPERLVIVGAGYAGIALARIASSRFRTTLIDRRNVTIHKIAGPRCSVASAWSDLAAIPIDGIFNEEAIKAGHKLIKSGVEKIDKEAKTLFLSDGSTESYDFLVLALGGMSLSPADPPESCLTREDCSLFYKGTAENVKTSRHVLIVGGGSTGVEISGEIRHFYPAVKVTLCESSDKLVKNFGSATSAKLLKLTESKGIHVIFNEKVKNQQGPGEGLDTSDLPQMKALKPTDGVVHLMSNKTIEEVDLVLWCVGFKPSTGLLKNSGMEDKLNEKDHIKVNSYLQVENESRIFAIGDCNNVPEVKLAASAGSNVGKKMVFPPGNADGVLANLLATSLGTPLVSFKSAFNPPSKGIITFGPKEGVTQGVPKMFLGVKGKSFMVNQRWKECKQPPPSVPAN